MGNTQVCDRHILCMKQALGSDQTRDSVTLATIRLPRMIGKRGKAANGTRGEIRGQEGTPADPIIN